MHIEILLKVLVLALRIKCLNHFQFEETLIKRDSNASMVHTLELSCSAARPHVTTELLALLLWTRNRSMCCFRRRMPSVRLPSSFTTVRYWGCRLHVQRGLLCLQKQAWLHSQLQRSTVTPIASHLQDQRLATSNAWAKTPQALKQARPVAGQNEFG